MGLKWNAINKLGRIYLIAIVATFLSGCDGISTFFKQRYQTGTLDGVMSCIKENEGKDSFLSNGFVRNACVRKHERFTQLRLISNRCGGLILLDPLRRESGFQAIASTTVIN